MIRYLLPLGVFIALVALLGVGLGQCTVHLYA